MGTKLDIYVFIVSLLEPYRTEEPITTDVVSSNLDQGEVYNIMCKSFSVTCDRSVVFSGYSDFLHR